MDVHFTFPANKDTPKGPFERCIYCRDSRDPGSLTLEHVIPEALGARVVLKRACCIVCLEKINPVEGRLNNKMFASIRAYAGMQTSKARTQLDLRKFPLTFVIDGVEQKVMVPIREHPMSITLPNLALPGALTGAKLRTEFEKPKSWKHVRLDDYETRAERLLQKHGATALKWEANFLPMDFARLIAKIGHCAAIHYFGIDSFRSDVVRSILGENNYAPYFVGTATPEILPPDHSPVQGHELSFTILTTASGLEILAGFVTLFSWLSTPTYVVLIGPPSDELKQQLRVHDA